MDSAPRPVIETRLKGKTYYDANHGMACTTNKPALLYSGIDICCITVE